MVHFDPAAIEAAGTVVLAAETGAAMMWSRKKPAENAATAPTATAPVAPAPAPVNNITVLGLSAQDFWIGVAFIVVAIILAAAIIHHGLTA
jgi:hypothetical protein